MLNVEKWYSEKWHVMTSPTFEDALKCCNDWLTNHNYTAITADAAKSKLTGDTGILPYPYCDVYDILEKLILGSKDYLYSSAKTYFNMLNELEAGEKIYLGHNENNYVISKISNARYAPNDYGLTQREIKEL